MSRPLTTAAAALRRLRALSGLFAISLGCFALPVLADVHNGFSINIAMSGNNISSTGGLSNDGVALTRLLNLGGVTVDLAVSANQFTAAKVNVAGTGQGYARMQSNSTYTARLQPPAGGVVKGGKLVLHVVLEGTAVGDADVHLVTAVSADFGKGTESAKISDSKTPQVAFDVTVPIAAFIDKIELAEIDVHMHLDATARLSGASNATSFAEGTPNTRVTGFRVFNGAGIQVPGFTMVAAGGNIPELAGAPAQPPAGGKAVAVEFFNAGFRHYFISANSAEIAKLDDGTFPGWARTGQSFNVGVAASAGLAPVCRFFTVAFPPSSSHFYAPRGLGCEGTLTNSKWQFEGDVFFVPVPGADGACPAGSGPVYRLYNNGRGGAPNHRFTTSETIRGQMLAEGFIPEGAGALGVGFCSPQ